MAKKYNAILIFGAPGIGKGTQGKMLGKLHGFLHFSTGDMFRRLKTDPQIANSEIGKKINVLDGGSLVSDGLTVELFFKTLEEYEQEGKFNSDEQILILDGIPRNAPQTSMIKDRVNIIKVIYLVSSDDNVLVERLLKRAQLEGRKDDGNVDVIRKRLETYRKETEAVLSKYPREKILEVDGFGTIENIHEEIVEKLEEEKLIK